MTVNMKIDLVGKEKRGLALRLNEFAGYISVALISFLTGYIAAVYGLKPHPFYIGIAFSLLALLISVLLVRDTSKFTELELRQEKEEQLRRDEQQNKQEESAETTNNILGFKQTFFVTSWRNRSLLAASQVGLVNNLGPYFFEFSLNLSFLHHISSIYAFN